MPEKPRQCVDCDGGSRPAPFPGPRCHTHNRIERKRKLKAKSDNHVYRMFGLTKQEYDELLQFQGGTCAMPRCRANGKARRLAVDHDHECTAGHPPDQACKLCVRGLLCAPHNYELIGKFRNSLQDALDYLADPPMKQLNRMG